MKLPVNKPAMFGAAAALMVGLATSAYAQDTTRTNTDTTRRTTRSTTSVTSSQRIPVRKDAGTVESEASGAIASPNADSLRADSIANAERMRQDSINAAAAAVERARQDSIAAVAAAAERARQDSIAVAEARARAIQDSIARADSLERWRRAMVGRGLYFSIGAGPSMPTSDIDNFYERGWNVTGSVGWMPLTSPIGVRLDVAYDRFNARDALGANADDPTIWSGTGEVTVGLPFFSAVSPYLVAGGGVAHFSSYGTGSTTTTGPYGANADDSMTKGVWNAGGGISFGIGMTRLFLESRYTNIGTPGTNTTYYPIVIGLTF